ncbi:hypothetical protein T484DRAFT_1797329 [Baffinella frigidus]|nr:hypothetical protein T484DRAFT_1797329 [Cryptophyta sp. CCMP2293]
MLKPSPALATAGKVTKRSSTTLAGGSKTVARGSKTVTGGTKATVRGSKTVGKGSKTVARGSKTVARDAKAASRGSKTVSASAGVEASGLLDSPKAGSGRASVTVRYPKPFATYLEAAGNVHGAAEAAAAAAGVVAAGHVKVSRPGVLNAYLDAWKTGDTSLLRPVVGPVSTGSVDSGGGVAGRKDAGKVGEDAPVSGVSGKGASRVASPQYPGPLQSLLRAGGTAEDRGRATSETMVEESVEASLPGALSGYLASVQGAMSEFLEMAGGSWPASSLLGSPQYPAPLQSLLQGGGTAGDGELRTSEASVEESAVASMPRAFSAYLASEQGGIKDRVSPGGSPQYPGPLQSLLRVESPARDLSSEASVEASVPPAFSAYLASEQGGVNDLVQPAALPVGSPQYPGPLQSLLRVEDTVRDLSSEASVEESSGASQPPAFSAYLASEQAGVKGLGRPVGSPQYPGPLQSLLRVGDAAQDLSSEESVEASQPPAFLAYLASEQGGVKDLVGSPTSSVGAPQYPGPLQSLLRVGDTAQDLSSGASVEESVEASQPPAFSAYLASEQGGIKDLARSPTSPVGSPQYPGPLQSLLRVGVDTGGLELLSPEAGLEEMAEVPLPGAFSAYLASVKGESRTVEQPAATPAVSPQYPGPLQGLLQVGDTARVLSSESVEALQPVALTAYLASVKSDGSTGASLDSKATTATAGVPHFFDVAGGAGAAASPVESPAFPAPLQNLLRVGEDTGDLELLSPEAGLEEMAEVPLPGAFSAYLASVKGDSRTLVQPATTGASAVSNTPPAPVAMPPSTALTVPSKVESVEAPQPGGFAAYLSSVQSGLKTLLQSVMQPSAWGVAPASDAPPASATAGMAHFFDTAGGSGAAASPTGSPQYPGPLRSLLRVEKDTEDFEGVALEESTPEEASLPGAFSAYLASVQGEGTPVERPVLQPLATVASAYPGALQSLLEVGDTAPGLQVVTPEAGLEEKLGAAVPGALSAYLATAGASKAPPAAPPAKAPPAPAGMPPTFLAPHDGHAASPVGPSLYPGALQDLLRVGEDGDVDAGAGTTRYTREEAPSIPQPLSAYLGSWRNAASLQAPAVQRAAVGASGTPTLEGVRARSAPEAAVLAPEAPSSPAPKVGKKLGAYPMEGGGEGAAPEGVTRAAQLKNLRAEAQSVQELGGVEQDGAGGGADVRPHNRERWKNMTRTLRISPSDKPKDAAPEAGTAAASTSMATVPPRRGSGEIVREAAAAGSRGVKIGEGEDAAAKPAGSKTRAANLRKELAAKRVEAAKDKVEKNADQGDAVESRAKDAPAPEDAKRGGGFFGWLRDLGGLGGGRGE